MIVCSKREFFNHCDKTYFFMALFHSIEITDLEFIALRDIEKIKKENIPFVEGINYYTDWFGIV